MYSSREPSLSLSRRNGGPTHLLERGKFQNQSWPTGTTLDWNFTRGSHNCMRHLLESHACWWLLSFLSPLHLPRIFDRGKMRRKEVWPARRLLPFHISWKWRGRTTAGVHLSFMKKISNGPLNTSSWGNRELRIWWLGSRLQLKKKRQPQSRPAHQIPKFL